MIVETGIERSDVFALRRLKLDGVKFISAFRFVVFGFEGFEEFVLEFFPSFEVGFIFLDLLMKTIDGARFSEKGKGEVDLVYE